MRRCARGAWEGISAQRNSGGGKWQPMKDENRCKKKENQSFAKAKRGKGKQVNK